MKKIFKLKQFYKFRTLINNIKILVQNKHDINCRPKHGINLGQHFMQFTFLLHLELKKQHLYKVLYKTPI